MKLALPPLFVWAARDAARRPAEALLGGGAMAALVTVFAAGLLLAQALANTSEQILAEGPSLVVRRVGTQGWAPMPLEALAKARAVRGVTRARLRVWGLARWDRRPVTISTAPALATADAAAPLASPPRGKALVGPALGLEKGDVLELRGATSRSLEVSGPLPEGAGLVAHDLVILAPEDARALLGLRARAASDLALWVFHDNEMEAIRPDLEQAFGFPVKITTQRESLGAAKARIERAAGLRVTLLVPGLLALALLTLAMTRIQLGARRDIGLLKALGWTSRDVVRLHLFRALVIALPAIALGWLLAYGLVFVGGAGWAGTLLFGWTGTAPHLTLAPTGVLLTLLEVGGLVLAPWLTAVVLPALRSATADPEEWLRGEEA